MAVGHISYNDQLPHGRDLRRCLQLLQEGHDRLPDLLAAMAQMVDGDGSNAAHFTYVTSKFGFASDAKAKEAWDELNSLQSKFSGDGSVTFVNAALNQAFAKFG